MSRYFFLITALLFLTFGCKSHPSGKSLKIAATATPHAEILEEILPNMRDAGIDMQIIVVDDYNIPNRALADGEVDANFFQHPQFLELQTQEFGYHFKILTKVHIEPMALYSKKVTTLANLPDGATIAIPSDPTNQARALLLLEANHLIRLNRHDIKANLTSIVENPKQLKLLEIDPPLLSRTLDDVDAAAITTNFALQGGLNPLKNALAIESGDSPFANVIVVRAGEEERPELLELKRQINSEKVEQFIKKRYHGAIIKVKEN